MSNSRCSEQKCWRRSGWSHFWGATLDSPSRSLSLFLMIPERSSPSRVRFAAPNNGAPLTAPGRSEQCPPDKRERPQLKGLGTRRRHRRQNGTLFRRHRHRSRRRLTNRACCLGLAAVHATIPSCPWQLVMSSSPVEFGGANCIRINPRSPSIGAPQGWQRELAFPGGVGHRRS